MFTIMKDKNQFCITDSDNRTVKISMSGDITSYTGRAVKNMPKGFGKNAIVDAALIRINQLTQLTKEKKELELLNMLLNPYYSQSTIDIYEKMINTNHLYFCPVEYEVNWNFKTINKIASQYEERYPNQRYNLIDLVRFASQKKLEECFEILTQVGYSQETISFFIQNHSIINLSEKQLLIFVKMLKNQPVFNAMIESNALGTYELLSRFNSILRMAGTLEIKEKDIPCNDMYKTYMLFKNMIENKESKIIDETLEKNQDSKWAYSNNDYVVIVPTTYKELKEEATSQHNCLSDYWLSNYGNNIKKGKQNRGVVFIRRIEAPNEPFITCDFTLGKLNIQQYFLAYNRSCNKSELKEFKNEYQAYLKTLL